MQKQNIYSIELLSFGQSTAEALLGLCKNAGGKPETWASRILETHAPDWSKNLALGVPTRVKVLEKACYRWMSELGIGPTPLHDEIIPLFASEFAGRSRGEDYLRTMFLGGIGDGQQAECTTASGEKLTRDLSDPAVISTLKAGGSVIWNGQNLKNKFNV